MRLITILLCSALVWGGVYGASVWGFHDLQRQHIPFAGGIVGTLFDLLFLALSIMLIFSTGIILYSSLFSSTETTFLLSLPAAADQIFAYKYQGALMFSSWAFMLLGSPIMIAYGLVFGVPWYFYAILPLYILGFVLLPGSLAQSFVCSSSITYPASANRLLRPLRNGGRRRPDMDVSDCAFGPRCSGELGRAAGAVRTIDDCPKTSRPEPLDVARTGSRCPRRPGRSHVFADSGLGQWTFLVRAGRLGFDAALPPWLQPPGGGFRLRRRYGGLWLDRLVSGLVPFAHAQTRLLVIKDFRTFRRDPAQWGQVLIFAGLLAFYGANTRRFYNEDIISRVRQSGVSLLNLTATAFLLCAYTGRFIYPMLSLEGRKFWILGLLPLRRERLLWGKFAFSATGACITAVFLVVFSDTLLGMSIQVVCLHALTVIILAVGLSGLSVGLGACMPNFRESDPSKIAVGFGGTVNLVIGLLFLLLVIGSMDVPYHFYAVATPENDTRLTGWWLAAGVCAGIGLGIAAATIPLRLGARALRRMEF